MKGKSINLKALVLLCAFLIVGLSGFAWDQDSQSVTDAYDFDQSGGWSNQTYGPGLDASKHAKYRKNLTVGDWAGVNDVLLESGFKYRFTLYMKKGKSSASVDAYLQDGSTTVSSLISVPYGNGSANGASFAFTSDEIIGDGSTHNLRVVISSIGSGDEKFRVGYFLLEKEAIASSCSGEPTAQASNLVFSNETTSSIDVSWTAGTGGDNYILVAKEAGNVSWTPTDGTDYSGTTGSGDFSSATDQGSGNKVVYSGSGTSATITGLSDNTAYYFQVFHYCSNASNDYLTSGGTGNDGSQTTSTLELTYCNPAPSSVDGNGIVRVEMGTIDNSTGTETNNYGDYSAQSTDVNPNTTVNVDITYETGYTYSTKIYIDWNNDKDFDDSGEEVYSGESLSANPTTLNASFSVPQSQATGTYRVRIGGADSGPVTPCYTGTYSSFEDYAINVVAATVSPEPSNHVSSFASHVASATQNSLTLNWSDNDGAEVAAGFLILGKTGSGNYAAVSDNNAVADDSDWSDDNFSVNVGHGVETYQVTGLDAGTVYDFVIYPYSNSGADIDYKTSVTVPSAQGTTTSAPPSISNISHSPASPTSSDAVSVTADVTDSDGTVDGVELHWGTSSGSLGNTIAMSLTSGATYTADSDIPVQANGTTVYYEIYALDNTLQETTSAEQSFTVTDPISTTLPYTEDFTSGFGDCFAYSASGATKEWSASSGYLSMNGYNSGDVEEDWVVLPSINLDNYSNEIMTFETYYNYGSSDANNYLKLMYSTDYAGSGDPSTANWTELSFTLPSSKTTWTASGDVDLSGISGSTVWIAFKYRGITNGYRLWQIDDISISEVSVSAEPSNHVSGFAINGASTTQSSITLDWSDNDGAEVAAGFLIVGKTGSGSYASVTDNNAVADDSDWSDDNFSVNVGHGVETYQVTGLDAGVSYDFAIYPYSNSGADIDYKTSVTVPSAQGTTTSAPPSISNISHSPASPTSSDVVTVTADVTDSDGVFGVDLNWGTASGSLGNTVSMTLSSGSNYTADIPAQLDGTTVYYEIYAMDNNGSDVASAEQSYIVENPAAIPYTQFFSGSSLPDGWTSTDFNVNNSGVAGGSAREMRLHYNAATSNQSHLTSEPINTSSASTLELVWKQKVDYYSSGNGSYIVKVQTSTDGSTFTDVWSQTVLADETSTKSITIDASEGAGSSSLYIRWFLASKGAFSYWYIDDIELKEGSDIDSEVDNPTTQVDPGTISSIKDTDAEAIEVFKFDILDWGTSDGQATDVTQITINAGSNNNADWSSQIQGAKLSLDGGSTFVTTNSVSVNASSLVFTINSGNLAIADGDLESVSLFVYLNTSVTDGEILQFEIPTASHGFVADASGSGFASSFSNTVTSNQITIAVEATDLAFGQQPSNVSANSVMTPSPTVSYVDANGNVDVDYDGAGYEISLSTTGSFDATATTSVAPVSGVSTFSNLVFDASGNALTVTATDGGWTSGSTVSSTFNVAGTPLYIQDFDGSTPTWGYSSDVTLFDNGWGGGYYGEIASNQASPLNYSNFSGNIFGENDLDDGADGTSGFATLTLEEVDVNGYVNVELSFDWEVVYYNANNDDAKYIVYYDGVSQGEVYLHDGNGSANDGEGSVSISVPDNVGTLSLEVMIRNNGSSGYSGFDNFRIDGTESPVLVVTEMMIEPTQVSDANGEWFEVFNQSAYEVDMQNYVISDAGGESFTISSSFVVPAKGLVVFGTNGNNGTNGGYDPDYVYAFNDFALDNTGDEIIISDGSGSKAEIDRVEYTAAWVTPGHANVFTGTEADDNNDVSNWNTANSTYGMGDAGSPGNSGEDEQVLPIELLSFDAEKGNHAVELLWSTATELNNDYFTIQRSIDGQHFQSIGQVYGAGSTHEQQNYTYIDHELFEGTVYYRLKQTDYDGQYSYTHTIALNAKDSELEIAELRVNETGIDLLLNQVVEDMNIQLFDAGGRLVYQGSLHGASAHIPNQRFEKGIYILRLYNNHVVLNKKLQL